MKYRYAKMPPHYRYKKCTNRIIRQACLICLVEKFDVYAINDPRAVACRKCINRLEKEEVKFSLGLGATKK